MGLRPPEGVVEVVVFFALFGLYAVLFCEEAEGHGVPG
jgi:hypothetical protein